MKTRIKGIEVLLFVLMSTITVHEDSYLVLNHNNLHTL